MEELTDALMGWTDRSLP